MSEETSSSVFSSSHERQDLSFDKFLSAAPRDNLDGTPVPVLGGIPLLRKLGEGGMGAVYYGVHPRLKTEVAIKVLTVDSGENSERVKRFLREGQICARIKSPHLLGVIDVNEDHGLRYLVMEFVNGPSAGTYLREVKSGGSQALGISAALDICVAATRGLTAAHAKGIIHRDIKPDNILIPRGKDGVLQFDAAKLADMGLAHSEQSDTVLTRPGAVFGTPGYLAPEQSSDAASAGKPSDVFSMGATLYTLLSGKAPFTGDSAIEVLLATRRKEHTPIRELRPEVAPAVAALIDRCLSKDPAARFADGAALLEALQGGDSNQSQPEHSRSPSIQKSSTQAANINAEPNQHPQRRLGTVLAVLLSIVAIGAATVAAYKPSAPSQPPSNDTQKVTLLRNDGSNKIGTLLDLGGGIKLDLVEVSAGVLDFSESRKIKFPNYYIGKFPVTVAQFRRFAIDSRYATEAEREGDGKQIIKHNWEDVPGASWKNPGFAQADDHPVVMVTLADAEAFAAWVARRSMRDVAVSSEVEWEYAARGTQQILYPWGKTWDGTKANHADASLKQSGNCPADVLCESDNDNFAFTSPVGHFNNASGCGAFDLSGNVCEWCEHPYGANPQRGWVRGGSWESPPDSCQTTYRRKLDEHLRTSFCGFRIVVRHKAEDSPDAK